MARVDELVARVQAAADATGNVSLRIGMGAPGSSLLFEGETFASGGAWTETPSTWTETLRGIATAVEQGYRWAEIATNGAAVAPTIVRGDGITAASKDEALDTLTLTLSPAFTTVPVVFAVLDGQAVLQSLEVVSRAVGSVALAWRGLLVDFGGSTVSYPRLDINSRTVFVLVVGKMSA